MVLGYSVDCIAALGMVMTVSQLGGIALIVSQLGGIALIVS